MSITGGSVPDILLVDDKPDNLRILSEMLRQDGYGTRSALSGESALTAALMQPPDLVLLDIMMPGMDGFEVCRRMRAEESLAHVPVIFLSALGETENKIEAFAAGGVDYVTKPFHIDEVRARVRTHLELHRLQSEVEEYSHRLEALVREQVDEIADSRMATIFALARLTESRDDETGTHLERVQSFCRLLAGGVLERSDRAPGLDESWVSNMGYASLIHDIGKVAISDNILLKPGKLTPEEFETMKTHTTLGAQTLEAVQAHYPRNALISMAIGVVRSHHERWDGAGYPDGLAADEIPLPARIMAVADVYDALRSKRVYKPAFTHERSRAIILEGRGTHFDPLIVDVFDSIHGDFDAVVGSHQE